MSLYSFVIPLGIASIVGLIITVLLGLRTKIFPAKLRLRLHIVFAIIVLVIALVHGSIVLYFQLN